MNERFDLLPCRIFSSIKEIIFEKRGVFEHEGQSVLSMFH